MFSLPEVRPLAPASTPDWVDKPAAALLQLVVSIGSYTRKVLMQEQVDKGKLFAFQNNLTSNSESSGHLNRIRREPKLAEKSASFGIVPRQFVCRRKIITTRRMQ